MGLFSGKTGVVFGIANERSIAWAITQALHAEGANMGFTHLPDKDPERPKNENKVRKLVDPLGAKFVLPCDVQLDSDLDSIFSAVHETFGKIDFAIHSVAFAPPQDLTGPVYNVSRDGFKAAMDISVYSLIAMTGRARPLLNPGGSVLTLTYLGGERVIPGYNLMGLCKSALDRTVEYLASELGPAGLRVNAISAGPVRTISSSGVGDFKKMLHLYEVASPLRRNIGEEEVGKAAMFLLSDSASGITGETLHVDCGYHVMGAPPPEAFNQASATVSRGFDLRVDVHQSLAPSWEREFDRRRRSNGVRGRASRASPMVQRPLKRQSYRDAEEMSAQPLIFESRSLAETAQLGRALARALQPGDVIALIGPLGAGKTQLVQAIAEGLDVTRDFVNSPTFVLIQEYEGRVPVCHIDAYRLKDIDEFLELGADELLGSNNITLIEWADRVEAALPKDRLTIHIETTGENSRRLEIVSSGRRSDEIVGALSSTQV